MLRQRLREKGIVLSPIAEKTLATQIVEELRSAGHEAYWAGGCVRDLLLGIEPSDYDVATSATPGQVQELFGHTRSLPVGLSFGVVIVLAKGRRAGQVEVATFRTDSTYSDGRRPDRVTFSTAKEDAQRRDFTINGMFYDPLRAEVLDFVGGQADLRLGVIRAIGSPELRIAEDKLRMLRAVRFAARFGFDIEENTRDAIQARSAQVGIVSGERIATELQKTLDTPRAPWAVDEWFQLRLLDHILPEVVEAWRLHRHSYRSMLDLIGASKWPGKLSVLLYLAEGEAASLVRSMKERLRLSNKDCDAMLFAVESLQRLSKADDLPWSQIQPLLVSEHIGWAVTLLEATCALGTSTHCVEWVRERLELPPEQLNPPPLLVGADLIDLGLQPGPSFKEMLGAARLLQLDGQLTNRSEACHWVREKIRTGY